MDIQDWSLVVFTIFAQMAVGAFIVLGIIHTIALRSHDAGKADRLTDRALLAIGPILIFSFLASLLHLGSPLIAWRAVANFGTSWLSREIVFGAAFVIVGGGFALMQWRKIATFQVRRAIAVVAAVIGVAFVFSMAQVYMLPTQPAWDSIATPVAFMATTLLLGSLAVGVALVATYAHLRRQDDGVDADLLDLLQRSLRLVGIGAVVLVGVQMVTAPLHVAALAGGDSAAVSSAALMLQGYGDVFALRLVFAFAGAAILGVFLYKSTYDADPQRLASPLIHGALGLVLIAEVLGRYMFYATNVPVSV